MGGGRADPPGRICAHGVDETRRLFRRFVRQAKDDDIDFAVELLLGGRVLARLWRQTDELQAGDIRQLLPDLEARGARFAVNEDCCWHDRLVKSESRKIKSRSRRELARSSASSGSEKRAGGHETRLSYKRPSWSRLKGGLSRSWMR